MAAMLMVAAMVSTTDHGLFAVCVHAVAAGVDAINAAISAASADQLKAALSDHGEVLGR